MTDYKFGSHNPRFSGTDKAWKQLKKTIAWWNEDTSHYPYVVVICPHCGAKNTHNLSNSVLGEGHRECDLMIDNKGKKILYDCPGYHICRWINTPR